MKELVFERRKQLKQLIIAPLNCLSIARAKLQWSSLFVETIVYVFERDGIRGHARSGLSRDRSIALNDQQCWLKGKPHLDEDLLNTQLEPLRLRRCCAFKKANRNRALGSPEED